MQERLEEIVHDCDQDETARIAKYTRPYRRRNMAGATRFMPVELGFRFCYGNLKSDVEVKCILLLAWWVRLRKF